MKTVKIENVLDAATRVYGLKNRFVTYGHEPATPVTVGHALRAVEREWVRPDTLRSPETRRTYRSALLSLIAFLEGDLELLLHRVPDQRWINWYMRPPGEATQRKLRAILFAFFRHAKHEGWIVVNPLNAVPAPQLPPAEAVTLTEEESGRVFNSAGQYGRNPMRNRVLLEVMYALALRSGEIERLRWGDLREGRDHASLVVVGKGGKRAVLPVPDGLLADWRQYRHLVGPVRPRDPIFPGRVPGRGLSSDQVRDIVHRIMDHAGVGANEWRTRAPWPHVLRHSQAMTLVRRGMALPELQRFMRHENAATTGVYLRSPTQMVVDELQRHHPLATKGIADYLASREQGDTSESDT